MGEQVLAGSQAWRSYPEKSPLDSTSEKPSLSHLLDEVLPILVCFNVVLWGQTRPGFLIWLYKVSWAL